MVLFISLGCLLLLNIVPYGHAQQEGDLRLTGGDDDLEGRAEMYRNGEWGTICDNKFKAKGWPSAFCQELGHKKAKDAFYASDRGLEGTGAVSFQSPKCSPKKMKEKGYGALVDCPEAKKAKERCGHDKDVFVICKASKPDVEEEPEEDPSDEAEEGDLRVVGGDTEFEGRAEMFRDGQWGTICDKRYRTRGWPTVFCQEMGHEKAIDAFYAKTLGLQGSDQISFRAPRCNPAKVKRNDWGGLIECAQDRNGKNCGHDRDVYVVCKPTPEEEPEAPPPADEDGPAEGTVRLAGGPNDLEGRAEMYRDGQWGSVCDKRYGRGGWPSVLCKELGYKKASSASFAIDKGLQGTGLISFHRPKCRPANGLPLVDCPQDRGGKECDHSLDVYIVCEDFPEEEDVADEGDVRLTNGSSGLEGVAEMYLDGQWGVICDAPGFNPRGWPSVFCKQLVGPESLAVESMYCTRRTPAVPVAMETHIAFQMPDCTPTEADKMMNCGTNRRTGNTVCPNGVKQAVWVRCE